MSQQTHRMIGNIKTTAEGFDRKPWKMPASRFAFWLDKMETLTPKAKKTLTDAGRVQHEHDLLAVSHMRGLLAARQERITLAYDSGHFATFIDAGIKAHRW